MFAWVCQVHMEGPMQSRHLKSVTVDQPWMSGAPSSGCPGQRGQLGRRGCWVPTWPVPAWCLSQVLCPVSPYNGVAAAMQ